GVFALADPGMVDQVLLNLVVNGRDAMPQGGTLTIATGLATLNAETAQALSVPVPGAYVYLEVRDTGVGIAPEIQARIFEPFFTTKPAGKGTGIGLATVFAIAKQHAGAIALESAPGEGACFRIYFPASASGPTGGREPRPGAPGNRAPGAQELILLVEDEVQVRRLTKILLERAGYRVVEAASGAEGLRIWEEHAAEIKLLITDIVMPGGMDGREMVRQLQAKAPQLPVIFTSGYSEEIAGKELLLQAGQDFLAKPVTPEQLLGAIRRSLKAQPVG
ncbi:MAG TPA: response regulator, partial [Verrucomicrobiae bacterium]